ncbi:MAG: ABC transporter permease [Oscillospiraceae bacterium]|nr:ABC transporter permease [Oscillospiraceae bacterium]
MAFLYAPIGVLIFFSFNQSKSRSNFTGFTLDWYVKLFNNDLIIQSLVNTLIVALVSSLIATVIGTVAAVGLNSMKKWTKSIIMNITYLPIVNPEIVIGVSFMLLFVMAQGILSHINMDFEFGYMTLILAHVTFNLPYVILNVLPKIRQMDKYVYDAALDLGCPPARAFFKVVMPEIMPGILSGFLMAFTYSLDDFVISYFVSGATSQTLPITIYSMTRRKVSPEINAISTIIFVIVLAVLLLVNFYGARKEKQSRREGARV